MYSQKIDHTPKKQMVCFSSSTNVKMFVSSSLLFLNLPWWGFIIFLVYLQELLKRLNILVIYAISNNFQNTIFQNLFFIYHK